jgi:predicted RND superfamily exporter protein
MQPAECYAEISQFQQQMAGDLLNRLHTLQGISNPQPPELADLPAGLVDRFVGHNGKHLLKIYGRGNIWDIEALKNFVNDVRSVDARATGNPLQAYEASTEMKESYQLAALYALMVILVVLWIDFRNSGHVLLAIFPLALSLVQTFGLMGLLEIPLNPANLIALPLIVGIGVDYGVHIVHNFLEQRGPYQMSPATAIAVSVDSLTTIIGFGALMIASHQGLQSLGRVLTLGIACCTITSLVILPAALTWITKNRREEEEKDVRSEPVDAESWVVPQAIRRRSELPGTRAA